MIISPSKGSFYWSLVLDDFEEDANMMKMRGSWKSSNITVSDRRKCTKSSLTFHNQNADHHGQDDDGGEGGDGDDNDDDDDVWQKK